ncbi:chloride channel protein 2 [Hyalella azteca]|uniref:Chloride channel protein 2 n=1 Tax=Hyalella azteca TaxID=294128 RepID=A0A8B7P681_HYAAZ|nr:chloride channel protein 2 [Hyalella azteca]
MTVTWKEVPNKGSDDEDDEEDDEGQQSFAGDRRYQQTLMYGMYRKELSEFAKQEAKLAKKEAKRLKKIDPTGLRPRRNWLRRWLANGRHSGWKFFTVFLGKGDWAFLLTLGLLMACISFIMDMGIAACTKARLWAFDELTTGVALQYLAWIALPVLLVLFSVTFVQFVAPQSIGSGIPEMKTIMRGVVLKEYLTWRTLVAKVVGLTATLGSGLPLGKEGPFVHIASIVAALLTRVVSTFMGMYQNEYRKTEMLAAAFAVGVACSFAAPIGGVLFSIEVTSVYFAVRNYWRGFFAAVSGAVMFRLLAVFYYGQETLTALFKTNFKPDFPFDLKEIFAYMFLGLICGLLGALFVFVHRNYVLFMRRNKKVKIFLQKYSLGFKVTDLFSNFTWVSEQHSPEEFEIVENWRTPWTGIFINLSLYIVFTFFWSMIASTLPVPSGIFIPVFKMGAAVGRLLGEFMAYVNPTGIGSGKLVHSVIPGGYSVAGAAAFAGAVTHTISTSVIVFELTGQITHLLPVMIAVLIANAVANLLQPSVYDSIIRIKNLPYLPDILSSAADAYDIFVERFMVKNVKYIYYGITYKQLKDTLLQSRKIRALPLVDSPTSMILLGSIQRDALISLLQAKLERYKTSEQFSAAWRLAAKKALESQPNRKTPIKSFFDFTPQPPSPSPNKLKNAHRSRRLSSSLEDLRVMRKTFKNRPGDARLSSHTFSSLEDLRVMRKTFKNRPEDARLSSHREEVATVTRSSSTEALTTSSVRAQSQASSDRPALEYAINSAFTIPVEDPVESHLVAAVENDQENTHSNPELTMNPSTIATGLMTPGTEDTASLPNIVEISADNRHILPDQQRPTATQSPANATLESMHQNAGKRRKNSRFEVTRVISPIGTSLEVGNQTTFFPEDVEDKAIPVGGSVENDCGGKDGQNNINTRFKTCTAVTGENIQEAKSIDVTITTNLKHTEADTCEDMAVQENEMAQTPPSDSSAVDVPTESNGDEDPHASGDPVVLRKKRSDRSTQPRKSILKKTTNNVLELEDNSTNSTIQRRPSYATFHGDPSKNWRSAMDALRRKMMPNDTPTGSVKSNLSLRWKQVMEQSSQEQAKWEEKAYKETVDFSSCPIDPSPFQLVESTSLLKVHSLFSMLGLGHAYVTVLGRLIGVVSLKELRAAIEAINNGTPQPNDDVGPDEGVDADDEESNVGFTTQNLALEESESDSDEVVGDRL